MIRDTKLMKLGGFLENWNVRILW